MPPRIVPAPPVEDPQQEVKPASKGVAVNYAFNTNVPNYVFNPALWHPAKGRKPSVDALLCYLWCIDKVTSVYEPKMELPTARCWMVCPSALPSSPTKLISAARGVPFNAT